MHPNRPIPSVRHPANVTAFCDQQNALYVHLLDLMDELAARSVDLVNSACGSGDPTIQVAYSSGMLDQIRFPSDLRDGEFCEFPLKLCQYEYRRAYFAWSQVMHSAENDAPPEKVVDALFARVVFRGSRTMIAEVAYLGFLGDSDASTFLRDRLSGPELAKPQ